MRVRRNAYANTVPSGAEVIVGSTEYDGLGVRFRVETIDAEPRDGAITLRGPLVDPFGLDVGSVTLIVPAASRLSYYYDPSNPASNR